MTQLGVGVMLNMLAGNESSVKAFKAALDKKIKSISIVDDRLKFEFEGFPSLVIKDDGQSCCEHRYMNTDDDLSRFVGAKLKGAEIRPTQETTDEHGEPHEIQFLVVKTTKGQFTVANHNEHNGYYGGFSITCYSE